jgi:hypothetical protein
MMYERLTKHNQKARAKTDYEAKSLRNNLRRTAKNTLTK